VSSGSLRDGVVWLRFEGVNKVREQDTVINEENRDVNADDIIVTLVGIEPSCEPVNIPGGVSTTSLADDGREPNKRRGDLASRREEGGSSDVRPVGIAGKATVNSGTTGMDNTLRDLFRYCVSEFGRLTRDRQTR
jgi:hypothetical protein